MKKPSKINLLKKLDINVLQEAVRNNSKLELILMNEKTIDTLAKEYPNLFCLIYNGGLKYYSLMAYVIAIANNLQYGEVVLFETE